MILKPMSRSPELDEALRRVAAKVAAKVVAKAAAMSPAEREAMYAAQRASWVRGEMAMGSDADEAEYRRKMEQADDDAS